MEDSEEFKQLTSFESDIISFLNSFRENPKILVKDLKALKDGLHRYRPHDPFIKDIESFLRQLKDFRHMKNLELNDSLSKYAEAELEKYMASPESFPPAKRGASCSGIISSNYLAENPGIIYTMEAQDPINVIEKIIFNEADSHRLGKLILTNPDSTQLGISHYEDNETKENFTVLILADNYIDDDTEKLPEGDISHLKMAFDLLDYDKEGRCKVENVLDFMTDLGMDETDPALFDIIKSMNNSPYVSWPKFANYVFDRLNDRYTYAGLNDIFQILKDNVEKNYIDLPKLRDICKYLGKNKTDGELMQMIKETTDKDKIYFEDFCEILGIEFDLLKSDELGDDPKTLRTIKIINKSLYKTIMKGGKMNSLAETADITGLNKTLNKSINRSLNKSINLLNMRESLDDSMIFKKKKYRYDP